MRLYDNDDAATYVYEKALRVSQRRRLPSDERVSCSRLKCRFSGLRRLYTRRWGRLCNLYVVPGADGGSSHVCASYEGARRQQRVIDEAQKISSHYFEEAQREWVA